MTYMEGCPTLVALSATEPALSEVEGVGIDFLSRVPYRRFRPRDQRYEMLATFLLRPFHQVRGFHIARLDLAQ